MSDVQAGLDPDEPQTPTWFTTLGIGIFLLGGIFFLINLDRGEPESVTQQPTAADSNTADLKPAGTKPVDE